jgi:hypothetical protein
MTMLSTRYSINGLLKTEKLSLFTIKRIKLTSAHSLVAMITQAGQSQVKPWCGTRFFGPLQTGPKAHPASSLKAVPKSYL